MNSAAARTLATSNATLDKWARHELALNIAACGRPLADRLGIAADMARLGYSARDMHQHIEAAISAARDIRGA